MKVFLLAIIVTIFPFYLISSSLDCSNEDVLTSNIINNSNDNIKLLNPSIDSTYNEKQTTNYAINNRDDRITIPQKILNKRPEMYDHVHEWSKV